MLVAATASTSVIAALTFWNTPTGKPIWQTLLIISALVAIAKPIMKTADKIQRLDEILPQYRLIEHELYKIEVAVRQRAASTTTSWTGLERFSTAWIAS